MYHCAIALFIQVYLRLCGSTHKIISINVYYCVITHNYLLLILKLMLF